MHVVKHACVCCYTVCLLGRYCVGMLTLLDVRSMDRTLEDSRQLDLLLENMIRDRYRAGSSGTDPGTGGAGSNADYYGGCGDGGAGAALTAFVAASAAHAAEEAAAAAEEAARLQASSDRGYCFEAAMSWSGQSSIA